MNAFLDSPGLVLTLIGVAYIVFIGVLAVVLPRVLTWRVEEPARAARAPARRATSAAH